jgi:citrate/tricarballylate utilization protein
MQAADTVAEGARVMAICNACRYCEQYCPTFQAMEERLTFAQADLNYLANLCHGCGECLYACQYAPPHEFAINVPHLFAELRVRSYEQYAWPAAFGRVFRRHDVGLALAVTAAMIGLLLGATLLANRTALLAPNDAASFYAVVPHAAMVALFGAVGLYALAALIIGVMRCAREQGATNESRHEATRASYAAAIRDALTLRHLHVAGRDCVTALEERSPTRRLLHHATSYGFALCFASTCVAALYHWSGSPAPYDYTSLPVLLGTLGGVAIVIGSAGLLLERRSRDRELSSAAHAGLDRAFALLLLLTAASGLLLLALRDGPAMAWLLIVHLGVVLALFVTLPYGKFVHGLYRLSALVHYRARERPR